jgi:hypothetical protein
MVARRLKSGAAAYYWVLHTWAKRNGCTLQIEALGVDYALAKQRCDEVLNPQFDAWRRHEEIVPSDRAVSGTFDWMIAIFKSSPLFQKLPARRKSPMTPRCVSLANTS